MKTGLLIQPDGDVEEVQIQDFRDMQRVLGGAFEYVPMSDGVDDLWINDEGRITSMPVNEVATHVAHLVAGDWIVGPALVLGSDEMGESKNYDRSILGHLALIAKR